MKSPESLLPRLATLVLAAMLAGCGHNSVAPADSPSSLRVTSLPSGAHIVVRGLDTGERTPFVFTSIFGSEMEVRLRLPGYEDYARQVTVPPGTTQEFHAALKRAYVHPVSPDSVAMDMASAFSRLDAAHYVSLLGSGFVFRPGPEAAAASGRDSLGVAEETAFVEALFAANPGEGPVKNAALTLGVLSRGSDSRPGHGGWKWLDVSAELTLERASGAGLRVIGDQRLYFRRDVEGGANWQLAEWDDVEPGGQLQPLTWSALRFLYLPR